MVTWTLVALIMLILIPLLPPSVVAVPALTVQSFLNTAILHVILVEMILAVACLPVLALGLLLSSLLSLLLLLLVLLLFLLLELLALLLIHFLLHLPVKVVARPVFVQSSYQRCHF